MHVKKFPLSMWKRLGERNPTSVRLKRKWSHEVICGQNEDYEGKLGGCGSHLVIHSRDLYRTQQTQFGPSFHAFMCPCCNHEQIVPAREVEINVHVPTKAEWLEKKRDHLVASLLLDDDFRKGINYDEGAVEFITKLGIYIPSTYDNN